MLYLSSAQNSQIKRLKALQAKAKKRRAEKAFVIEGFKEIAHAIRGGYHIETLFLKEGEEQYPLINKIEGTETITVSSSLLEQICYRKTSKAIAVAQAKEHGLDTFHQKSKNPFILVAEAPEKPGNIGALLRTADGMGVDCFIIIDAKTDLYNPNVVRSSVGCLFSVPVITTNLTEAFDFFRQNKIQVYSAALTKNAKKYTAFDFTGPTAIAVGTEGEGLSPAWLAHNSTPIIIPMLGQNDSLNVSVAAGIILAEVQRQRN
jgi:TrmH family RNA methyltransferase